MAGRPETAAQIAIDPDGVWHDPDAVVGSRVLAPVESLLDGLSGPEGIAADPDWLGAWRAADDAAGEALVRTLGDELSEPIVARSLGEWLGADATLFVASSMPIRDVELFLPAREDGPRVLANRGANGIDGTVSAAFGAAAAAAARWCC